MLLHQLEAKGVDIERIFPLNRRFKYMFVAHKLKARLSGKHFVLDRHPVALARYAAEISRELKGRRVDLVFSNSSIPLTALENPTPKAFWTDAVWHDMKGYYGGQFANPSEATDRLARQQEVRSLSNVDLAVYTSEWAASTARRLTDPQKVKVVPRGANVNIDHDTGDIERWIKLRIDRGTCQLLFMGVDWERKGGAVAVKTAEHLISRGIPTTLTIIGCDPKTIPPFAKTLGFVSKASVKGQEVVANHLKQADFLIMPTHAEAGGIVFSEASAYGVPSLAYRTGGVSEYIHDQCNGFTLDESAGPADFAARILDLLSDRQSYAHLARHSYLEYKRRLNWATSTDVLIRYFEAVIKSRINQRER